MSLYYSSDHVAQRTDVLYLLFKTPEIIFLVEKNKCIVQHFNISTINEAHNIKKKLSYNTSLPLPNPVIPSLQQACMESKVSH